MRLEITKEGRLYKNGKEKKLTLDNGYLTTNFMGKKYLVHRLVAQEYISNPNNLPQVNHINGIKTDNRVENLEWVTAKQNIFHRDNIIKTGIKGEKVYQSKFSDIEANKIRSEYRFRKITQKKLSEKYHVCEETIGRIIRNKTYAK
jgi:hypothetical protein